MILRFIDLLLPLFCSSSSVNVLVILLGWLPKIGIDWIRWVIFTFELVGVFNVTTAFPSLRRFPQIVNSKFGFLVSMISMEAHRIIKPPSPVVFLLLLMTHISPLISPVNVLFDTVISLIVTFCFALNRNVFSGSAEISMAFSVIVCPKSLHPCVETLFAVRVSPVGSTVIPGVEFVQMDGR